MALVGNCPLHRTGACWLAVGMSFDTKLHLVSKETGFQSLMVVVQHLHPEYDSKFIKSLWYFYRMQKPLQKALKSLLERMRSLHLQGRPEFLYPHSPSCL